MRRVPKKVVTNKFEFLLDLRVVCGRNSFKIEFVRAKNIPRGRTERISLILLVVGGSLEKPVDFVHFYPWKYSRNPLFFEATSHHKQNELNP